MSIIELQELGGAAGQEHELEESNAQVGSKATTYISTSEPPPASEPVLACLLGGA